MRFTTITIALAALLVSGAAGAAGGNVKEPGKGAEGPKSAGEGPSGGSSAGSSNSLDKPDSLSPDGSEKVWEVSAGLEYHHMIAPQALNSDVNRNVNYWALGGRWDITPYDRITVAWGVYQRFISDQGETGARLDDILFTYTRRIPLPGEVNLRISASLTAPTSYGSQLATVYTEPRLSVGAEKKFGKYFSLDARVRGAVDIVKNTVGGAAYNGGGNSGFGLGDNGGGSNPNTKGSLSARIIGDLTMPFHEPLSVGFLIYDSYAWFYSVGNSMNGMLAGSSDCGHSSFGVPASQCMPVQAVTPPNQPWNQFYGYEINVKYNFPSLKGFKTDLAFTFSPLGDATLGWTPVVRGDGSYAVLPYYRQSAEFYFSLNGRY